MRWHSWCRCGFSGVKHRIFVTDSGGIVGGSFIPDATCATFAAAAGLLRTYKAVVTAAGTASGAANSHITISGTVFNIDAGGQMFVVAENATAFWGSATSALTNAVIYNEFGAPETPGEKVWTGTNPEGTSITANNETCSFWTNTATTGFVGLLGQTDGDWLKDSSSPTQACNLTGHVYYISQ